MRPSRFGNLDSEDDVYQYDSSEFQFIGFDELTSFSERQYTYLFSRLRTTKDNPVPLRMRSASNPGNRGHDWVKARFMIGQPPEALQRDVSRRASFSPRGSPTIPISAATSISRRWPISTRCAGASSSTVTGRSSPSGNLFRREWFAIVDDWPREVTGVVRAWDDAATRDGGDWTVGVLMAMASQRDRLRHRCGPHSGQPARGGTAQGA